MKAIYFFSLLLLFATLLSCNEEDMDIEEIEVIDILDFTCDGNSIAYFQQTAECSSLSPLFRSTACYSESLRFLRVTISSNLTFNLEIRQDGTFGPEPFEDYTSVYGELTANSLLLTMEKVGVNSFESCSFIYTTG